jgi:hypothetical protein
MLSGPKPEDLSWPPTQGSTLGALWQDFQNDPLGKWLITTYWDRMRIGAGLVDVVLGVGLIGGTGGTGVIPGVGLIAVGLDQIVTGGYNILNPKGSSISVFEYGGYSGAMALATARRRPSGCLRRLR